MSIEEATAVLDPPKPLRLDDVALFLDLDGTLAHIADRPQDVHPDPRRTSLLERLAERLDGRMAVISGRTLTDIDRILERCVTSAAAVHGLVIRDPSGVVHEAPPHHRLAAATEAFHRFAEDDPGLIVEEKGLSVALHYRQAPARAQAAQQLARRLAAETGLALQDGDMVQELRTPGPSKGDSVRAFMRQAHFQHALPIFLGDDVTDEDGFEAVQALGGFGVLVGPPRPTLARFRLAGVDAALAWLESSL